MAAMPLLEKKGKTTVNEKRQRDSGVSMSLPDADGCRVLLMDEMSASGLSGDSRPAERWRICLLRDCRVIAGLRNKKFMVA